MQSLSSKGRALYAALYQRRDPWGGVDTNTARALARVIAPVHPAVEELIVSSLLYSAPDGSALRTPDEADGYTADDIPDDSHLGRLARSNAVEWINTNCPRGDA